MTAASEPKPRAAIVYNPNKGELDVLRRAMREAEQRNGWAESLWFSAKPRSEKPIQRAVQFGVDLVIVSGGDGSVRRSIRDLVHEDVSMAILPMGTGNLLARNLDLPLNNLPVALDIAMTGSERVLDVLDVEALRASGRRKHDVSVVLSGVGLDAAMIANTKAELKKRFGWLAYIDGVRRSLGTAKSFDVRISIDGHAARSHRVAAVFIANLSELPGNVSLVPGAKIDDGLLDVVLLQPKHFFDWVLIWRRFSWENAVLRRSQLGRQIADSVQPFGRNQVLYRRGREVTVWIEGEPQPFQIDGDSADRVQRLHVAVNTRGVRVRGPNSN